MRYLITGANGFIGSRAAGRLVEQGEQVRCLVRPNSDLRWLSHLPVEYHYASLFDDKQLRQSLEGVDRVLHFAGLTRALRNRDYRNVNVEGTRRLLEAAALARPGLDKLVHISSLAAVGPSRDGRLLDESTEPHPLTPYGKSKLESERVAETYKTRLPIVVLRPPVVYGPRDRSGLALFKSAARGRCLKISGCNPRLNPIHADDLVSAVLIAAAAEKSAGNTYFVCGKDAVYADELQQMIAAHAGKCLREVKVPLWLAHAAVGLLEVRAQLQGRPNKINFAKLKEIQERSWLASAAKIREELGFSPAKELFQGTAETYRWYAEAGWL